MYHWIEDKDFLKRMRKFCSGLINQLVQAINNEGYLSVEAHLVGSGARNLETQNGNLPIDLDYNLDVINSQCDINDGKTIKEYVRKIFNKILKHNELDDCSDSTSCLTTSLIYFTDNESMKFSIDLAIVHENNNGTWYRLIHEKTGFVSDDKWIWNKGPSSRQLTKKVKWIKDNNLWNEVRDAYLNKKNMYLKRNDNNHSSFNCYIEAVNEIYNKY